MLVSKRIDLLLLEQELTTALVPVPNGLGHSGTDTAGEVFTYDGNGKVVDLPPEAAPVVEAHMAPPRALEYAGAVEVAEVTRTTDDTPTEIYRLVCEPSRQYAATLSFLATDAAWNTKLTDMRYAFKRLTGAAMLVGEAPLANVDQPGSAAWDLAVAVVGNDLVVRVIGGRTTPVDWLLRGTIVVFAPAGL